MWFPITDTSSDNFSMLNCKGKKPKERCICVRPLHPRALRQVLERIQHVRRGVQGTARSKKPVTHTKAETWASSHGRSDAYTKAIHHSFNLHSWLWTCLTKLPSWHGRHMCRSCLISVPLPAMIIIPFLTGSWRSSFPIKSPWEISPASSYG